MPGHPDELDMLAGEAAALVGQAIVRAVEQDGVVSFKHETQVHKLIDLMRSTKAAPELLARLEGISCSLAQLPHLLRDGRVNLYASRVLRLKKAALALPGATVEARAGRQQHRVLTSS
jgi:hypothetical protein